MNFRLLIFGLFLSLLLFPQLGFAQTVTKSLYFHVDGGDGDTDEDMDRVAPSGASASTVTIADGGADLWIQYPAPSGNIVLKGTHSIIITISSVTGAPDITAELAYYSGGRGGTYTAIANTKITNATAGVLTFNITRNTTILAGDPLAVTLSEKSGGGDSFDVEFDSAARQSRLDLSSESFISIPLLQTYQAAFPNTTIPTAYNRGDTAYIRSYVDDPFGYSDIYSTTLIVIDPNTSTVVNAALAPIFSFGVLNVYEYSYVTGDPLGQYDYTLISDEGTEGTVSAQRTGSFYVYDKTRVKLSELHGVGYDGHVALTWDTSMEIDNLGFNVYRSYNKSDGYERVNPAFIPGLGSSTQGGKYLFIDYSVENGQSYYYKIEDVENGGKKTLHRPVTVTPYEGGGTVRYLDGDYVRIASTNDIPDGQKAGGDVVYIEGIDGELKRGLEIISSDENTMNIQIRPPEYQVIEVSTSVGSHHEIRMDGYGLTDREGYPRLPTRGYMLTLPAEGDVSLVVQDTQTGREWVEELYPYVSRTAPAEEAAELLEGSLIAGLEVSDTLTPGQRKHLNKLKSSGVNKSFHEIPEAGPWPEDTLLVERVFNNNNEPQLLLRFYPVQLKRDKDGWIIQSVRSVRARIIIKENNHSIKNIDSALKTQFDLANLGALKIRVTEDGIKRLGYQELLSAGFDMDKDPRLLTLYTQGEEIPVLIQGETDGSWGVGDFIEFYGEGYDSEYSDTRVYWLAYTNKRGPRIPDISSPPEGAVVASDFADVVHLEENRYYYANLPDGEGKDHWFWTHFISGWIYGDHKRDFPVSLKHVSPDGDRGWVKVNLQAITSSADTDPDHHTRVYLNNNIIGDFYWDGPYGYQFSGELDHSLFTDGENILSIEEVADTADVDFLYLNSVDVVYYRQYIASDNRLFFTSQDEGRIRLDGFIDEEIVLYDISRPESPLRLVGAEIEPWGDGYSLSFGTGSGLRHYAAFGQSSPEHPPVEKDTPSDLHSCSQGADYIIISHPDFLSTVQPLANHRAGRGLRVVTADVEEIYDEFSYGNFDPEAIRSYISHAWFHWPKPSPQNVLLVGGGTVDSKDYRNLGSTNFIPPYLIKSGTFQTASDNRYVAVEGEDNLPEMGVGRLPVWDSQTLEIIIDRIIQYETGPPLDGMENRICLVADDSDGTGAFEEDIDQLIENRVPPGVTPSPVYLSQLGAAATRQEIIDQFELGNLIIHYQGHGSIDHWASEKIFKLSDVPLLNNASKLPFVEAMTCLNGYFINPGQISLAEQLLYSETGGAVAVWASTGYGHDQAMKYLADRFLEEIYTKGNRSLGSAITRAKINFLQYGAFYDEIDTFTLFGDPALELK